MVDNGKENGNYYNGLYKQFIRSEPCLKVLFVRPCL